MTPWLIAFALAQAPASEPDPAESSNTEEPAAPDAEEPATPDAEEPATPVPAPAPVTEPTEEEIVVYGELALAKARDQVVREMERLGWRSRERSDGTLVFRGPSGWMGSARFDPELASLDFRRSVVGFRLADYEEPAYTLPQQPTNPAGVASDAPKPSGAGFWLLPRKDKVDSVWRKVREVTADEVANYQDVLYATAFEERVRGVGDRLDALWSAGVPIDDRGPPVPESERMQAVVDFWATRADTPEGLRMTRAVEAWITNRLAAVPSEVRRAAEQRREDGRPFPTVGG